MTGNIEELATRLGSFGGAVAGSLVGHLCDEGFSDEEILAYIQFLCTLVRQQVRDLETTEPLNSLREQIERRIRKILKD